MKKIIILTSFYLTLFSYTHSVHAETVCYDVEGEVKTTNILPEGYPAIPSTQQEGIIELSLTDKGTGEEVLLEGHLSGTIIGFDEVTGAVLLSHTITSNDSSVPFTFVTFNDNATVVGGLTGCSLPIEETITEIVAGAGFTENVESVNMLVKGTINVINQGGCSGVQNIFEDISGEICLIQE